MSLGHTHAQSSPVQSRSEHRFGWPRNSLPDSEPIALGMSSAGRGQLMVWITSLRWNPPHWQGDPWATFPSLRSVQYVDETVRPMAVKKTKALEAGLHHFFLVAPDQWMNHLLERKRTENMWRKRTCAAHGLLCREIINPALGDLLQTLDVHWTLVHE